MPDTMTKSTLLETMSAARERWDALIAEVGPARLAEPGVEGDWSVKEIVAHVTAWEEWGVIVLRAAAGGESPPAHPIYNNSALSTDERNARLAAAWRDRSPDEVLASSRQTFQELLAAVAALAETDLVTPGRFPWTNGEPLWQWIAGDSWEHYEEDHAGAIRAWLGR